MTALEKFNECYPSKPKPQEPVGHAPAVYLCAAAAFCGNEAIRKKAQEILRDPEHKWRNQLNREELRTICQDSKIDPLVAFCCCMAWGKQWSASSFDNFHRALNNQDLINNLNMLRCPNRLPGESAWSDRKKAFVLFEPKRGKKIAGLAESYFTKLIFFFLQPREKQSPGYIQDTWTKKSYQVLKDHFPNYHPSWCRGDSDAGHYEDFCRFVDLLAHSKGWTGSDVETALFGDKHESSPGLKWREYVDTNIKKKGNRDKPDAD